jgi:putative ATP-dependent endonuclease of OLD family
MGLIVFVYFLSEVNLMNINKVYIENFKIFRGSFELTLNKGINILVGNNEAGKSTIIEAIHLVLTGLYNGKYLKNELTQYIFNCEVINEYIESLKTKVAKSLPHILIELYFAGENLAEFEGNGNSKHICLVWFMGTYLTAAASNSPTKTL